METREGIISSREPNFETGRLKDCTTFEDCPFDNPAKVQIEVNDKVIYVLIYPC